MSLDQLKQEVLSEPQKVLVRNQLKNIGYRAHLNQPNVLARAYALESLFSHCKVQLYPHDRVAGSLLGIMWPQQEAEALPSVPDYAGAVFGERSFITNADHYGPDYQFILNEGIGGILEKINRSRQSLEKEDPDFSKKSQFLSAAQLSISAFAKLLNRYAEAARTEPAPLECRAQREEMACACARLASGAAPESFYEALTLVWFCYLAFVYEGRYAMAFGRMDQYLWPFYQKDSESGRLTQEDAIDLLAHTLYKIGQWRSITGGDDVSNIAVAGVDREGRDACNPLSFAILEAVHRCNIPGPNLSARIAPSTPDAFLKESLRVIGTGLGYPALMNDPVNVEALARMGYPIEEARDYCMVGCIENFLPGKQPPWSDGRYNVPKYLEYALTNGRCLLTGRQLGPATGEPGSFHTMEEFMAAFQKQLEFAAEEYVCVFNRENGRLNPDNYMSPFLSCFARGCLERARDINDGGTPYPSVHGAGCMGIATVADSLAAIEKMVFVDRIVTLPQLVESLQRNFKGDSLLKAQLLACPKYGNNDDFVDKYAVWYVDYISSLFDRYRTRDGGRFYIGIASNVNNIPAGLEVGATPDGRGAREPLSDAASPMYGRDKKGPLSVAQSLSKPDYRKAALGTVLNQKFSPAMFATEEKLDRMVALVRTYFAQGGQEMQINSVSREILADAMENPDRYRSLVVRVSGFSAYYVSLDPAVQLDILSRTEQA